MVFPFLFFPQMSRLYTMINRSVHYINKKITLPLFLFFFFLSPFSFSLFSPPPLPKVFCKIYTPEWIRNILHLCIISDSIEPTYKKYIEPTYKEYSREPRFSLSIQIEVALRRRKQEGDGDYLRKTNKNN